MILISYLVIRLSTTTNDHLPGHCGPLLFPGRRFNALKDGQALRLFLGLFSSSRGRFSITKSGRRIVLRVSLLLLMQYVLRYLPILSSKLHHSSSSFFAAWRVWVVYSITAGADACCPPRRLFRPRHSLFSLYPPRYPAFSLSPLKTNSSVSTIPHESHAREVS